MRRMESKLFLFTFFLSSHISLLWLPCCVFCLYLSAEQCEFLFILGLSLSIKAVLVSGLIHSTPSCSFLTLSALPSSSPPYILFFFLPTLWLTSKHPWRIWHLCKRGGSSDCCKEPDSWQLWERTADPAFIKKVSRDGIEKGGKDVGRDERKGKTSAQDGIK